MPRKTAGTGLSCRESGLTAWWRLWIVAMMKKSPPFMSKVLLAAGTVCFAASCAHRDNGARITADGRVMHAADRLQDFYLAEKVDVRGLGVTAALAKLEAAYQETCRQTGEVPLKLTFEVPPGHEKPLGVRLGLDSFDRSVRYVGAAAKLEVERRGTTYRFKAPRETGQLVRKSFAVPPDFLARLTPRKNPDAVRVSPRASFLDSGIDLEDSTNLSLSGSKLDVETRSAADLAAIGGTIETMRSAFPVQQKVEARIFEVAAGSGWKAPRAGNFEPRTAERLLADLEQRRDVKAEPMPSFVMRVGEVSAVRWNGDVLRVNTSLVGWGHELQTAFTRTRGGRAEIHDRGYVSDSGTRLTVKTRPDGTRVVFAVTPTLIDATGRPAYGMVP